MDDYNQVERNVVESKGNLMAYLAKVYGEKLTVDVLKCEIASDDDDFWPKEKNSIKRLRRIVNIKLKDKIVYTALSLITLYDADLYQQLCETSASIGSLMESPTFTLFNHGRSIQPLSLTFNSKPEFPSTKDGIYLYRSYLLESHNMKCHITETFHEQLPCNNK